MRRQAGGLHARRDQPDQRALLAVAGEVDQIRVERHRATRRRPSTGPRAPPSAVRHGRRCGSAGAASLPAAPARAKRPRTGPGRRGRRRAAPDRRRRPTAPPARRRAPAHRLRRGSPRRDPRSRPGRTPPARPPAGERRGRDRRSARQRRPVADMVDADRDGEVGPAGRAFSPPSPRVRKMRRRSASPAVSR